MSKGGYVYIMSNHHRTTFYIGVTNNLSRRTWEHRFGNGSGFTKEYNCHDLIYYKFFPTIDEAIEEERRIKKWKREWKEELIRSINPKMNDLYEEVRDYV